MHSGDTTTPAERLRLLQDVYLVPGAGPQAERVSTTTEPGTPIRLAVYDHIQAAVTEVARFTADILEDCEPDIPQPTTAHHTYQWMIEQTAHLDDRRQQARDAVIHRQGLEHAILMGDTKVIRRHACPRCDTWGLTWDRHHKTVACLNRYCADDDGRRTTWSLAQIAEDHIRRQIRPAARAT